VTDPAAYHAWYATRRGAWIATRESRLLQALARFETAERVLDVGCGTAYFASALADRGLQVTGLDSDEQVLQFAAARDPRIALVRGRMETLPFADGSFDHVIAITSLCFVRAPDEAVREMWRVCRRTVTLGLLHRRSLLYLQKARRNSYAGARWDRYDDTLTWLRGLAPTPKVQARWAVFLPSGDALARALEHVLPGRLPLGSFLAVCLRKPAA